MRGPKGRLTRSLTVAASSSYLGNCLVGAAAALQPGSTRKVNWLHHVLYIGSLSLTIGALSMTLLTRDRTFMPLAGAAAILAVIPRFRANSREHRAVAACAAPFYTVALVSVFRR